MNVQLSTPVKADVASIWAAWMLALWACSTWHLRSPLRKLLAPEVV